MERESRSRFDRKSVGKWWTGVMTTSVMLYKYNGHAGASLGFPLFTLEIPRDLDYTNGEWSKFLEKTRGHVNVIDSTSLTTIHGLRIYCNSIACNDHPLATIATPVTIVQTYTDCDYHVGVGVRPTAVTQSRIIPSAPS